MTETKVALLIAVMLPYGIFNFNKMNFLHIKRAFLWIEALSISLFKFWAKNPQETPAIVRFILEKSIASPRFLSRNVLTEKHFTNFKTSLKNTAWLYQKFGRKFTPSDPSSYQQFENVLKNKSQLLYFLIRKLKSKVIVETGVAAGESTGYILQALKDNGSGRLYSIDLPFQWYIYGNHTLHLDSLPAGKMPGYLVPNHLKTNWELILGNTYDKLPALLEDLGRVDIFFHDSEHSYKTMLFEYKSAWPYIKDGGLLLSDDVSYTKAFNKFSKLKKVKNIIFKDLGVIFKNG